METEKASDHHKAREVYERGLKDFPDSVWLKTGLAWTYLREITFIRSEDPKSDIDHAYALATEAAVANNAVSRAAWRNHFALVPLFWLHDRDDAKAVAEAEIVHSQMPDDARIHAVIAGWMVAVGRIDRPSRGENGPRRLNRTGQAGSRAILVWPTILPGATRKPWRI
jgi:hypothetical protein